MKNIAYYISDHGYGHAARSIAVIRELLKKRSDIEVTVNCSYPLQFVIDNLVHEDRVKFRRVRNDFGYYTEGDFSIDKDKTENRLKLCLENIDSYINGEKKFCEKKGIDLIISDISAKPFEVADLTDIPSVGISNFTWWEVYEDLLGDTEEVDRVRGYYEKADLGLILPLNTGVSPFKDEAEVGLVSRGPTKDHAEIRKGLGQDQHRPLIYFSMGKSLNGNDGSRIKIPEEFRSKMDFISFSDNGLLSDPDFTIPQDIKDSQNFIAASDLVVSKFGYSTAAEAIRTGKPMILTRRDTIEDEEAVKTLKRLNIAEEFTSSEFMSGGWLEAVEEAIDLERNYRNLPDRFRRDGVDEVIRHIEEYL